MKKFFTGTVSIFKRLHYGEHLNPLRDWFTLLILSAIALAGIIVWNALIFDTVASGGTIGASATSTFSAFNRSSLDTIQTIFADRKATEEKYETGAYRFFDPSQ